jgi:hypothetical protein
MQKRVAWNKGHTKLTHPGLLKMSRTLSAKKKWNFSEWRARRPKIDYSVNKSGDWAELVGITLGDGNIFKFPRTERLVIACNSKDTKYIEHIKNLIKKVLKKEPQAQKSKNSNCVHIKLYQCRLSKRLRMPSGNKIQNSVVIPEEIYRNRNLLIRCLKGLFETDGCFIIDKKNYTRVIEFKNMSRTLLKGAYLGLKGLSYHPQFGKNYVRLARKDEVYNFADLIQFRRY